MARIAAFLVDVLLGLVTAAGEDALRGAALRGASDGGVASQQAARAVVASKALQVGDAGGRQLAEILSAARHCFAAHRIDTTNLGNLQGTLGAAVGCVARDLAKAWGWAPAISNAGSQSCGQCEGYGLGSTVVEVDTEAGRWMFVLQLQGAAPLQKVSAAHGHAVAVQQGDATSAQLAVILRATNGCFREHSVDTSNVGRLDMTLGNVVACVLRECERAWGWKPEVNFEGSHSCGPCDSFSMGSTMIAMDGLPSGDWLFELRLK